MEGSLGPWRALERESGAEKWPAGDGEGSRLGTAAGLRKGKPCGCGRVGAWLRREGSRAGRAQYSRTLRFQLSCCGVRNGGWRNAEAAEGRGPPARAALAGRQEGERGATSAGAPPLGLREKGPGKLHTDLGILGKEKTKK